METVSLSFLESEETVSLMLGKDRSTLGVRVLCWELGVETLGLEEEDRESRVVLTRRLLLLMMF